jgi:RNA recognition motif-containing protein
VKEVRIARDRGGKPKGYAYIEFDDEAAASMGLRLHRTELFGRIVRVVLSSPSKKQSSKPDRSKVDGHGKDAATSNETSSTPDVPPVQRTDDLRRNGEPASAARSSGIDATKKMPFKPRGLQRPQETPGPKGRIGPIKRVDMSENQPHRQDAEQATVGKSNADFRAMVLKGK